MPIHVHIYIHKIYFTGLPWYLASSHVSQGLLGWLVAPWWQVSWGRGWKMLILLSVPLASLLLLLSSSCLLPCPSTTQASLGYVHCYVYELIWLLGAVVFIAVYNMPLHAYMSHVCGWFFQALIFIGETCVCLNWAIVTDMVLVCILNEYSPCRNFEFTFFIVDIIVAVHSNTNKTFNSRSYSNFSISSIGWCW